MPKMSKMARRKIKKNRKSQEQLQNERDKRRIARERIRNYTIPTGLAQALLQLSSSDLRNELRSAISHNKKKSSKTVKKSDVGLLKKEFPKASTTMIERALSLVLKSTKTKYEKLFEMMLIRNKIEYKFQKIFMNDKSFFIADFYIPSANVIFEIDGVQHYTEEGARKDKERTVVLKTQNGVKEVFRFDNTDIGNRPKTSEGKMLKYLKSDRGL
jgi:very-short-patch-repair endonuclease